MNNISELIPFLAPLAVIQIGLQVYCVVNLVKRGKVRFNSKLLWGFIIVIGSLLGSVVYLVFRGEDE